MTTPFHFTVKRRRQELKPPNRLEPQTQRETIGLINGLVPGSIEEWRVYLALVKLGIPFDYQVPMAGAFTRQRGSVVLDFLLYDPFPIPIMVNSLHWHTVQEDEIAQEKIAQVLGVSAEFVREHVVWDYEIATQADADRVVRARVR